MNKHSLNFAANNEEESTKKNQLRIFPCIQNTRGPVVTSLSWATIAIIDQKIRFSESNTKHLDILFIKIFNFEENN